jgi:hypothetical protein
LVTGAPAGSVDSWGGAPASRAPYRVVAADWSGAKKGAARHLWIAEWDPTLAVVGSVVPASREDAVAYLCELASRDPGLLVGLDFNFSFPEWWLDACAIEEPRELWEDAPRLEAWLAECSPPFWGRPGRRRPHLEERQHFRVTELAAGMGSRRPKSVFQIGGAGSVGTASLRGMPALAQLRRAGFAIWPFDDCGSGPGGCGRGGGPSGGGPGGRGGGSPAVTEVWPRLAAPAVIKRRAPARLAWLDEHAGLLGQGVAALAGASDDAFDAVAAVIALAAAGRAALIPIQDRIVQREGWIAGVPLGGPACRSVVAVNVRNDPPC